jgi:tetratricopeptide (TPR) repeat protein
MREPGARAAARAPVSRLAGVVLLSLATLFAAWQIGRRGLADFNLDEAPETSLSFHANHPAALVAAAGLIAAKDQSADFKSAADLARRALALDPFAPGAMSVLGFAENGLGASQRGERLMRLAGDWFPRDFLAQAWLFDAAMREGNTSAALQSFDVVLRAHPGSLPQIAPLAERLLKDERQTEDFAKLLSSSPPWRSPVLEHLSLHAANPTAVAALFSSLLSGTAPPKVSELQPFLNRLLKDGRLEQAYALWLAQLPSARLPRLGLLYNNAFQYEVTDLPFDWVRWPLLGAVIEIKTEGKEASLAVTFSGVRVPFSHVTHLMALRPGRYRFQGESSAGSLQSKRPLRWRVFCYSDPAGSLGTADMGLGNWQWKPFAADFDVPSSKCDMQQLVFELPYRAAAEQELGGEIAFRNMDVVKR